MTEEYEEMTIHVPKQIMNFLRQIETEQNINPQEYAETSIIEMVNADREALIVDHVP